MRERDSGSLCSLMVCGLRWVAVPELVRGGEGWWREDPYSLYYSIYFIGIGNGLDWEGNGREGRGYWEWVTWHGRMSVVNRRSGEK